MNFPKIITFNLIKGFSILLITTSTLYADTNTFDDSSGITEQYNVGDIISEKGDFQTEVLTNTKDSIEIGLINQTGQVIAMLSWEIKAESGSVILNLDTEDETSLPLQITEQTNSENHIEALAKGLYIMNSQTNKAPPEEQELKSDDTTIISHSKRAITTTGTLIPSASFPSLTENHYEASIRENITRKLNGFAVYNLTSINSNFVWVRLLAHNYATGTWEVLGWTLANRPEPSHNYSFTIPEEYDMDLTGNDLQTASISKIEIDRLSVAAGNDREIITTSYSRRFVADAWTDSGPGKLGTRTNFKWAELTVKVVEERDAPSP